MGFFSWNTSNTEESIPSSFSTRDTIPVALITSDGQVFIEREYEGYGVFGGKDIFVLIAELNGKTTREEGLDITYDRSDNGDFSEQVKKGYIFPKLFELQENEETVLAEEIAYYIKNWENYPYPEDCEFQGFFYPGDEDGEEDDWEEDEDE